ncbi:MAG: hypothetical protein Q9204_004396 [Flavoplaca sp. TL-2023a]
MAPNPITLSHLPYEIRQKIFTNLITIPWPIIFDGSFRATLLYQIREVDKTLAILNIFPSGPRLFYENNVFDLSEPFIPSFLTYTLPSSTPDKPTTPQNHVTRLSTYIQPMLYGKDGINESLRLLLSCPRLCKVDVEISAFYGDLCEFDATFRNLREALWVLGKKLGGDEGLSVELRWLNGRARWMMEDLQRARSPVYCGKCGGMRMGHGALSV